MVSVKQKIRNMPISPYLNIVEHVMINKCVHFEYFELKRSL